jgi:hypothetical protein
MYRLRPKKACITFNQKPVTGSWGGGNQWLKGQIQYLKRHGYQVTFKLGRKTDCVVIVNSKGLLNESRKGRKNHHITFGLREVRNFKAERPCVPLIHRINDTDIHRESSDIDEIFRRVNEECEFTVFISDWIYRYYRQRWWTGESPFWIINNSADSTIFNTHGTARWDGKERFKIITHHWSDNPRKGFDVYERLDSLIYSGEVENIEFNVVGNYPKNIKWRAAKITPPLYGPTLANELKASHAYITGSRYEASGMHWIEGVQCGLPILYRRDGGAVADLGKHYGICIEDDLVVATNAITKNYKDLMSRVMSNSLDFTATCESYTEVIKHAMSAQPSAKY